jgi:predicted DsbA family dithiol-disulfide isomerase
MMPKVEITYFTDPYCSWCWATEPMFYRIRETYREQVHIRYVMGGLVRDMADFYDSLNDIRTTEQVAPHWREVSQRSGQPIDERLMNDIRDPHFSTWPACRAVKAAFLQGEEVGERFLRRMRRAALTERQIISHPEVYLALAQEVEGLDLERLRADLENGTAERAFQADLAECRRYGATGFPTLLFRRVGQVAVPGAGRPLLVVGHRPFATYRQVLRQLAPELQEYPPREVEALLVEYGPLTTRELAEVHDRPAAAMASELKGLEAEGRLARLPVRSGEFWALASPVAHGLAGASKSGRPQVSGAGNA